MKHFNQLTPAEAERLALLMEECAEVQQVIGKILRHGYESSHPKDAKQTTNRGLLERELGDVQAAVIMMIEAKDLDEDIIQDGCESKLKRVVQYLHHQGDNS